MMRPSLFLTGLAVAGLVTACGSNVSIEQAPSLCVSWKDGGAPAAAEPGPDLACEPIPGIGVVGNGDPPAIEYVCIEPGENGCPSPSEAHATFGACIDERTGPSCQKNPDGTFEQGTCTVRETVSACGPDPAAAGACCYYAYVVQFDFTS